jgi:penicillin amidase
MVSVVVLITAITITALAYYAVRRPLPKQEGELVVGGTRDAVTIYRDGWGVPHIYAATPYDLFFAQGFIHAQDRWLQMDISRHIGRGRLGELIGENEPVQTTDRLIHALGWEQIAKANWIASSPESRAVLLAYAAGVNAYIEERDPGQLALEYTLLNLRADDIQIEPWTPIDSLAWLVALHWQNSGNASRELEHALALTRVDEGMLALYSPLVSSEDATTPLPPTGIDYTRLPVESALAELDLIGPRTMQDGSTWVVSGAHTASGQPLLAAAPGQPVQMPSTWYEVGLYCLETVPDCPYNVTGFSIPGVPTIVMGHNAQIAWGWSSAWIDEQDVYVIRLNSDRPAQYAWNGDWLPMEVIDEPLTINGVEEPLPFTFYRTALGPVIAAPSPLLDRDQALVLRWTGMDLPADPVAALLHLNRAQNWDEFRVALSRWGGAAVNVVYADVAGNIGYQLAGRVPIRSRDHAGVVPIMAEGEEVLWRGYVPFEALPSAYNPPSGTIIAANTRAVTDPGYRAGRIAVLLNEADKHTVESFAEILGDTTSPYADVVLPVLRGLELGAASDMLAWLETWDRRYAMDSPQAALFGVFWLRLIEFTYADELGHIPCDCPATQQAMADLLAYENHPWWDDVQTRFVVERRDAILRKAFEQAVIDVTDQLGPDREAWRWGDLHSATFANVLTLNLGVSLLEEQFNRGPVAVGGSADTINATRSNTQDDPPFQVLTAPSARMIIDLSDFESSRAMHTTGQSHHLASPHYDDMIDPWRFNEYHNMLWNHTTIEETADAVLDLEPVFVLEETPELVETMMP